jgi:hypothetical protein
MMKKLVKYNHCLKPTERNKMSDHNSIVINCRLEGVTIGECTIGELQDNVDSCAEKYVYGFTRITLQGLIDKIKEQQEEIDNLRADILHEEFKRFDL